MICVRCGAPDRGSRCAKCSWPYARHEWVACRQRIRSLTLDTNCVNARSENEHLNQLEGWEAAGYVELRRAPAFIRELRGPATRLSKAESIQPLSKPFTFGQSVLGGSDVLAGPSQIEEVRNILFPSTKELRPQQELDIEHLAYHNTVGSHLFVTLNDRDFIRFGKQEQLAFLGIWVFSPEQAVEFLSDLYDWPRGAFAIS